MKLISFNVNGLRSRLHQLEAVIERHRPAILGLQETKVQDADFPLADIERLGYWAAYQGQKTHYGVALLSVDEPRQVQRGLPDDSDEAQKRLVGGDFALPSGDVLRVVNGYFPQGENRAHPLKFPAKRKFYADLLAYLRDHCRPDQPLALMGDFNIAPVDADIGIGEENAKRWLRTGKTSFLPEEREWLASLKNWGLVDSFRQLNPTVNGNGFNPSSTGACTTVSASKTRRSTTVSAGSTTAAGASRASRNGVCASTTSCSPAR